MRNTPPKPAHDYDADCECKHCLELWITKIAGVGYLRGIMQKNDRIVEEDKENDKL